MTNLFLVEDSHSWTSEVSERWTDVVVAIGIATFGVLSCVLCFINSDVEAGFGAFIVSNFALIAVIGSGSEVPLASSLQRRKVFEKERSSLCVVHRV